MTHKGHGEPGPALGVRSRPPSERNNYEGTFVPTVNPATTPAMEQAGPGDIGAIHSTIPTGSLSRLDRVWPGTFRGNGKTVVRLGFSLMRNPEIVGLEYIGFAPFGANVP